MGSSGSPGGGVRSLQGTLARGHIASQSAAGLATFLTMDIDGDQAAPVDLVLEPDGTVFMRRCFASRVLQLSLGPNLLPPASIEALCATLGRMDPRAWEMTGTKH